MILISNSYRNVIVKLLKEYAGVINPATPKEADKARRCRVIARQLGKKKEL